MPDGFGNISNAFTGVSPIAGLGAGFTQGNQNLTSILRDLAVLNIRNKQTQALQAAQISARQQLANQQIAANEQLAASQQQALQQRQESIQQFNAQQRQLDRENALKIAGIQKSPRPLTIQEKIATVAGADKFLKSLGINTTAPGNQEVFDKFVKTGNVTEFKPIIDAVEKINNEAGLLYAPEDSKELRKERHKLRKYKDLAQEFENLRELARLDPIKAKERIKVFTARKRALDLNYEKGNVNLLSNLRQGFVDLIDHLSSPTNNATDALASGYAPPVSGGPVF